MSMDLSVLDMHKNHFHGNIPATFPVGNKLSTLNLRDNQLEGALPNSLSNCKELKVLDLGNNNFRWLGTLPKLQVLSLRSNNLQGNIRVQKLSFSSLRILDLSNNNFTGSLPAWLFNNLRGMMRIDGTTAQLNYMGNNLYKDSVVVIIFLRAGTSNVENSVRLHNLWSLK